MSEAMEAMKLGAFDYMEKPFELLEEFILTVDRAYMSITTC
ncbi:MAG: hypothetical protein R2744_12830 [Bacteroidales bacterium]